MKTQKYFYMGLGMLIALAIGAGAFAFTESTQAAASDVAMTSSVADDGFDFNLDGGFGDVAHPGPGRGGRGGFGGRDNSALLEELGVTQEQWDAAKLAVQEANSAADERPDSEATQAMFAEELGVTVEEIEAAQEAVKAAKLEEALASGEITQEQLDLQEARKAFAATVDNNAIMAGILGVTAEELDAAKADGTMRDLVTASGLTTEEISAATEAALADALDQAVADGIITQAQADQIEEAGFSSKGFGGGRGHGGHGGKRGGRGNSNNTTGLDTTATGDA